jgi:hypothetical protein
MIRSSCETHPDEDGQGVTMYSFKIWEKGTDEPEDWNWQYKQSSSHALRKGGVALLAHYADVTFGDVQIVQK